MHILEVDTLIDRTGRWYESEAITVDINMTIYIYKVYCTANHILAKSNLPPYHRRQSPCD